MRSRPGGGLRLTCALAALGAAACAPPPQAHTGDHAAAAAPVAAASHDQRVQRIETSLLPPTRVRGREYAPVTVQARMEQLGVPAVSVAVISDGRIAWAKAYGVADAESGAPATTETLFQAASMSKPVAATGALALVQEGRLTLDDDVNRWLRRWRVPAHEWEADHPVTLRLLLSHTAGLTVHGFPGYAADAEVPTVVQVLAGERPANTDPVVVSTRPGEVWRYSGGGTIVVQLLIEEVTGVPFARFMEERVLEPIGMTASTYEQPLPAERASRAATAHRTGSQPIPGRFHVYPEMAAAGLWTTPTDLARWILHIQKALDDDRSGVLEPEMARAMIAAEPGSHGLGPQVDGRGDARHFAHGGSNAGFRGVFIGFVERGEGAVIMTNSDAGGSVASELLMAIAAEYDWPHPRPVEIVPVAISPEALREYEGRYGTADQPVRVLVKAEGESLIMDAGDGRRREYVPVDEDRFAAVAGGTGATFDRATNGAVEALRVAGLRLPRQ